MHVLIAELPLQTGSRCFGPSRLLCECVIANGTRRLLNASRERLIASPQI